MELNLPFYPRRLSANVREAVTSLASSLDASSVLTWGALIAVLGIALAWKLSSIQRHVSLGLDPANYLVTMNALFGNDPTGLGLARPPLVAIPMKVSTVLFGTLTGIKVLGAFSAAVIGIPFYLLVRRATGPYIAIVTSVLFVFSSGYSSMVSWGFISLFGIFFILLTAHSLLLLLAEPSRKHIFLTGLSASLLVGFHQVSAVEFVLIGGVFVCMYLVLHPGQRLRTIRALGVAGLVAGVLSAVYLPMYRLALAQGSSGGPEGITLGITSWQAGLKTLKIFYPDLTLAVPLAVVSVVGIVAVWQTHRSLAVFLLAVALVSVLAAFVTVDGAGLMTVARRLPYLSYIPMWAFAGVALSRLLKGDGLEPFRVLRGVPGASAAMFLLSSVVLGIFLAVEVPASQRRLEGALSYYKYLDASQWETLQWIAAETPQEATFVAHSKIFGWWIEGAAQRDAFETRDAASFYRQQGEESGIADLVLSRSQGLVNGLLRVAVPDPFPSSAGGDPVIGVFAAGQYQDVLLFHDHDILLEIQTNKGVRRLRLDSLQKGDTRLEENGDGLTAFRTVYTADGIRLVRTISLGANQREAQVSYQSDSPGDTSLSLSVDMNLFLGQGISVERVGTDAFRKSQAVRSFLGAEPIITEVHAEAPGADLSVVLSDKWQNHVVAHVSSIPRDTSVSFHVQVISPGSTKAGQVQHYSAPELLQANGIDFIAVDTKTGSPLFNDLPWRTVWWLSEAPYLTLAYEHGDVQVYRVNMESDLALGTTTPSDLPPAPDEQAG